MPIELIGTQEATDDKESIETIKQTLTEWADSIPHHGYKNFGEKVTIKRLASCPSYGLFLHTQYERRTVEERREPYSGKSFPEPSFSRPDQVDPWNFELDQVNSFTSNKEVYTVQGSERVITCSTCNGVGTHTCPQCHGHGRHTCPSCKGGGEKRCSQCEGRGENKCQKCNGKGYNTCTSCSGSGTVRQYRSQTVSVGDDTQTVSRLTDVKCESCSGRGRKQCTACRGAGKTVCSHCGGKGYIICKQCGGSGSIVCERCRGAGKITCTKCEGKGSILEYLAIVQKSEPYTRSLSLLNKEVTSRFPGFDIGRDDVNEILSEAEGERVSSQALEAPEVEENLNKLIEKNHNSGPLGEVDSHTQILFEKAELGKSETLVVDYEFLGNDYSLIFYGPEFQVYAPDSPFSKLSDIYYKRAEHMFKSMFYGKCVKYLEKAVALDIEQQRRNEIERLWEKAHNRMLWTYRWGEYAAKLVSVGAAWYGIFKLKGIPEIPLPYFKSQYNSLNLPAGYYQWFLLGLFTVILFGLRKKIKEFIYRNYGSRIRNGIMRFLIGFVYTVLFAGLVYSVVMLAHATGILPAAGLVLNKIYNFAAPYIGALH